MEKHSNIVRNKAYEDIISDLERQLKDIADHMNTKLEMSRNHQNAMNEIGHECNVLSLKKDIIQKQLIYITEEYDNQGS